MVMSAFLQFFSVAAAIENSEVYCVGQ